MIFFLQFDFVLTRTISQALRAVHHLQCCQSLQGLSVGLLNLGLVLSSHPH